MNTTLAGLQTVETVETVLPHNGTSPRVYISQTGETLSTVSTVSKSPRQVLSDCFLAGVELSVDGDSIRYRGTIKTIKPSLLDDLQTHKPAILELLRDGPFTERWGPGVDDGVDSIIVTPASQTISLAIQGNPAGDGQRGVFHQKVGNPATTPAYARNLRRDGPLAERSLIVLGQMGVTVAIDPASGQLRYQGALEALSDDDRECLAMIEDRVVKIIRDSEEIEVEP